MPDPEYKVANSIPGRIRLRILKLRDDADFATRLKALVSGLEPVSEVRVDRAAASIVVQYDKDSVPAARLQEGLATAIKEAADPRRSVLMNAKVLGYAFQSLTAYEYLQVQEILRWRQKPSSILANLSGKALSPLQTVTDALIPKSFLKKAVHLVETSTDNWHQEWETLKQEAKLDDLCQLKKVPLEECDRLCKSVEARAVKLASVEGGAGAFLGIAGEMVDADLFLRLALETIRRTSLCYGYAPQSKLEQQFAWAILEVTTALTDQERHKSFARLRDLHHVLYQQTIGDLVQTSVQTKIRDVTVEAVLKGVLQNIAKLESVGSIPVVGIVTGIAGARATIEAAATAAHREYQLRWLLENQQGRSSVQADPE